MIQYYWLLKKFPNKVPAIEPPREFCRNEPTPLHALVKKFNAHVSSDVYVLERKQELDILWETYYIDRPKCIFMRALETCDRRTRQGEILDRRGKLQRRMHFRGMNVTTMGLMVSIDLCFSGIIWLATRS